MNDPAPLVFVGGITYDVISSVSRYPDADERVIAGAVIHAGGGPAATAAVTAARLGAPNVHFLGAVGTDSLADRLLAELVAEGVGVDGVVCVPGAASGASVVIVDSAAGTRSICAQLGPALIVSGEGRDLMRRARWVHTDHIGWRAVAGCLDTSDVERGPKLSVDISYPTGGFSAAGVDLFVPALESLTLRYPDATTDSLLDHAVAEGASTVVATKGGEGCVALTADGARHAVGGQTVDVVSTLGAGDVFHGALLAAIDRGETLPTAMTFANHAAALACRALDGRSAIPRIAELTHLAVRDGGVIRGSIPTHNIQETRRAQ